MPFRRGSPSALDGLMRACGEMPDRALAAFLVKGGPAEIEAAERDQAEAGLAERQQAGERQQRVDDSHRACVEKRAAPRAGGAEAPEAEQDMDAIMRGVHREQAEQHGVPRAEDRAMMARNGDRIIGERRARLRMGKEGQEARKPREDEEET